MAAPVQKKDAAKFVILGSETIPVDKIYPNPRNPRPVFHFGPDNPEIRSLGDSIRTDGLKNPIKVYEFDADASPGEYRLVQGHRRLAGAKFAGVDSLEAIIIAKPLNEEDELEWLGSEDAHKRAWSESGLFQMRHAWELAKLLGMPTAHPEIIAKTGLTNAQLQTADKIFRLEEPIQAMLIEYERVKYEQLINGQRKSRSRVIGSGVTIAEFPPERAALVWDLFEALRIHLKNTVKKYSDVELQKRLAQGASQAASVDTMRNLLATIRGSANGSVPGLIGMIDEFLENPERKMRTIIRSTKSTALMKLAQLRKDVETLDTKVAALTKNINNIGTDLNLMKETDRSVLKLVMDIQNFETKLARKIDDLEKEQQR